MKVIKIDKIEIPKEFIKIYLIFKNLKKADDYFGEATNPITGEKYKEEEYEIYFDGQEYFIPIPEYYLVYIFKLKGKLRWKRKKEE